MTTSIYSVSDTQSQVLVDGVAVVTINKVGGITKGSVDQMPVLMTSVPTTLGSAIETSGIPNWINELTFMLSGVSTTGATSPLIQLGSTTIQTTGYICTSSAFQNAASVATTSSTSGFLVYSGTASQAATGNITFTRFSGNKWICTGNLLLGTTITLNVLGEVTLAGALDRIRLFTTDAFDAGSYTILYK